MEDTVDSLLCEIEAIYERMDATCPIAITNNLLQRVQQQ